MLALLGTLMFGEQFHDSFRQRDGVTASTRLDVIEHETATLPAWAPAGMVGAIGGTWWRAGPLVFPTFLLARFCLVVLRAALVRVVATVQPGPSLQSLADP